MPVGLRLGRFDPGAHRRGDAEINPDVIAATVTDKRFGRRDEISMRMSIERRTGLVPALFLPLQAARLHGNAHALPTVPVRFGSRAAPSCSGAEAAADAPYPWTGNSRIAAADHRRSIFGLLRSSRQRRSPQLQAIEGECEDRRPADAVYLRDSRMAHRGRSVRSLTLDPHFGPWARRCPSFPGAISGLTAARPLMRAQTVPGESVTRIEAQTSPLGGGRFLPITCRSRPPSIGPLRSASVVDMVDFSGRYLILASERPFQPFRDDTDDAFAEQQHRKDEDLPDDGDHTLPTSPDSSACCDG